jgi:hypothetical protein
MISRFLLGAIGLAWWGAFDTASAQQGSVSVTTYHYDNLRTGWNSKETVLTTSNVNAHTFGVLHQVTLDDQVDAQPLVVNNVVYVVTENNTVYAIDGASGAILKSNHLGPPVQSSTLPAKCANNGSNVGIQSTPVIDVAAAAPVIYVVTYTWENNKPVYRIRQLALYTLGEINNTVISASNTLSDGKTGVTFNAQYQRQRAALLEANGNVYAAFASFCDAAANYSRGWVLGWQAGTLTPMPANELTDRQTRAETLGLRLHDYYLSTIWMSGYGIASDSSGDLFFTTGNSDTVRTDNLQESAVRLSSDLTAVKDYFTPFDYATSDNFDREFGAGGLMVLPDQSGGPLPHLAVAAGKAGKLYIMNRDLGKMGGYVDGGPDVPPMVGGQPCWCGPSYFQGSDGIGRVVVSHGNALHTYKVNTTASIPLILDGIVKYVPTGQDYGFFTVVSSNGTQAGSAIIWAVGRPMSKTTPTVTLYAYSATTLTGGLPLLYSAAAGPWPNLNGNANLVPVVTNGNVYVASYRTLTIFGLLSQRALQTQDKQVATSQAMGANWHAGSVPSGPRIFGTVTSVTGDKIDVRLRSGRSVTVDLTDALKNFQTVIPYVGEYVLVQGTTGPGGTLAATAMTRAKGPETWGADVQ